MLASNPVPTLNQQKADLGIPRDSLKPNPALVQRSAERELIPAAAAFGLGVLVWSPLSRGFLSGKYQRGRTAPAGSRLDVHKDTFRALDNEKNWNLLDVVGRVAEQHETTHAAVSLAWLLARPQTSSIILGVRTEAQLEDNLRTLSVKLTSEDTQRVGRGITPRLGLSMGRYPRFRIERGEAPDLTSRTGQPDGDCERLARHPI